MPDDPRQPISQLTTAELDRYANQLTRCLKALGIDAPGAVLGDLAGAARHHVLVTLPAALRVVDRAEAVGDRFDFFEHEAIVVE